MPSGVSRASVSPRCGRGGTGLSLEGPHLHERSLTSDVPSFRKFYKFVTCRPKFDFERRRLAVARPICSSPIKQAAHGLGSERPTQVPCFGGPAWPPPRTRVGETGGGVAGSATGRFSSRR